MNNIGIATIVGGTIGPLIARSYGASNVTGIVLPGVLGVVYFMAGVLAMRFAQVVLKELVE